MNILKKKIYCIIAGLTHQFYTYTFCRWLLGTICGSVGIIAGLIIGRLVCDDIETGIYSGFTVGLTVGIALGVFIGNIIAKRSNAFKIDVFDYRFKTLLLLADIMKADDLRMDYEYDKVKNIINKYYQKESDQKEAFEIFENTLEENVIDAIDDVCDEINEQADYQTKINIVFDLLDVAYSDDEFDYVEKNDIDYIINKLNISDSDKEKIYREKYEQESKQRIESEFLEEDANTESLFKHCLLILLAEVTNADEIKKDCEYDRVMATIQRYYKTEEEQKEALHQFHNVNKKYDIKELCKSIKNKINVLAKSELIMELLAVVYADDIATKKEREIINKIVEYLNIPNYNSIRNSFMQKYKNGFYYTNKENSQWTKEDSNSEYNQKSNSNSDNNEESYEHNNRKFHNIGKISINEAYSILGVSDTASEEEVKKAYHALAIIYHPDNATNLGDEAIRQATETMKQINVAWETVKMARGMK